MQAFKTFTGKVIPLAMKDVDTDMIIPAQYLTQINRDGYGAFLFKHLKERNPQFVFNQQKYTQAEILLTESNFGCGSSREHAVWALLQAGIKVIVAESFSDIFFNNAAKNGLLLISLSKNTVKILFEKTAMDNLQMTINLESQKIIIDGGESYTFEYDPFRKNCLLNGYDDMDYLLSHQKAIDAYYAKKQEKTGGIL